MGWQDREYNAGREQMSAFFANPASALQFALPIFRSRGLTIHLSFWFLLSALFTVIDDIQMGLPAYIPLDLALILGVVLFHELGHRVFARLVGGNHWEWVLWPLGGMVAPTAPRTPKATFVANVGGIVFNLLLILLTVGALLAVPGMTFFAQHFLYFPVGLVPATMYQAAWAPVVLHTGGVILSQCTLMILINLFPCYWFDGGHLWQSVLWPWLGQWKAMRITCLAGMILVVPFFLLSLFGRNFFGMIFCVLIFSDCFRRRQALAAAGPGVMDEDDGPAYNYMDTPDRPTKRKKLSKRGFTAARKKARRDQAEQAKIDSILDKVKEKGLHSLTWWEKRTLKKATERQRQQDLSSR